MTSSSHNTSGCGTGLLMLGGLFALLGLAYLAGKTNLPGVVLGWFM